MSISHCKFGILLLAELIWALGAVQATEALEDQQFPPPDWCDAPNPLAHPGAVAGGELTVFAGQAPQSLNAYLDLNAFSAEVFGALFETLLNSDPLTADYVPGLATNWIIGAGGRTFTFTLDEHARWSDGRPVTADDVAWTFQTVLDPKHMTGVHKVALEQFEPPEVLDPRRIRFTARDVHWRHLGALGGLAIMPRHAYVDRDFNLLNFEFPVVSGPYQLGDIREGAWIKIERRTDWWARRYQRHQQTGNFQTLTFRFYAEQENAYEAFLKGQLDLYPVYTARIWVNETKGERFLKNWIIKQQVRNRRPLGFQGFAMNMRRPLFGDLRVRQALAHLLDREKMNRTLMYSQYFLHRSYFEDLYNSDIPCQNPVFDYNPAHARVLLVHAGWQPNPRTGQLEKDGRPFIIRFLSRDPTAQKFLAIYAEDLRAVGIELRPDEKDWAAWLKDMDEYNYDMTWAAWGASLHKDPEGMWASHEANRPGGNNLTGFFDPRVDQLIAAQTLLFDVEARHALCREIDALVASQVPYVLLWNTDSTRILYWNKFGMPDHILGKYGDERFAYWYWWHDEDSAALLEEARSHGFHLPPRSPLVVFPR